MTNLLFCFIDSGGQSGSPATYKEFGIRWLQDLPAPEVAVKVLKPGMDQAEHARL